jgi:TRAP-type mannitol/chloroaromatic compound transport system substrate-binding protein
MTQDVSRRGFLGKSALLTGGVAAAAATTLAAPAIAQENPTINWRCTSGFPGSLDTIFGGAQVMAKHISDITGGKFTIQVFQAGEIVPTAQAIDAVQNNTVEMAHTAGYYYVGKDPTFALLTAVPFGMNQRQQFAWLYHGGGNELIDEFISPLGIVAKPGGGSGAQMGGWYRKPINSLADIQGLKMRIAGLAGQVMAKLGAVPQQLPGGEIYPALERGTIDAAEWVGPYDDEKLGFYQVAPYYAYPAFWEGGPTWHYFFNKAQFDALPAHYQAALNTACQAASMNMVALYDVKNTSAIRSLVGKGVTLQPLPKDVMDAAYTAANALYAEISSTNAAFKKIYDPWKTFRDQSYEWFRVAEYNYDSYVYAAQAAGQV